MKVYTEQIVPARTISKFSKVECDLCHNASDFEYWWSKNIQNDDGVIVQKDVECTIKLSNSSGLDEDFVVDLCPRLFH